MTTSRSDRAFRGGAGGCPSGRTARARAAGGVLAGAVLTGAIMAGALPGAAQVETPLAVPSGQLVTFIERVTDAPAMVPTWRYRFVAEGIAGAVDFEQAAQDMAHLCRHYVLPALDGEPAWPQQVVISLAAAPVPFGATAPEVVQYFEAYRPEPGDCVWEQF